MGFDRTIARNWKEAFVSLPDYEEALALLQAHQDDVDYVRPQEESLIAAAETALGLAFPPMYRRFVRELGTVGIGSEEIYGITSDDFTTSSVPDGIWLTLRFRDRRHLPPSMIVLGTIGDGSYYVLDTAQTDSNGECLVVSWAHGWKEGDPQEVIASDFGAYFLMTVKEGIASLEVEEAEDEED